MKIGIDARMFSDSFTGIGRYTFELSRRFFVLRPEVEWVLFLNEPEFGRFEFPPNVKKVLVGAGHYGVAEQTKFWWMLERERCDLVHFTHFNVPLLYRRPYIVTIHDTIISFYPGKKMGSWWRKWAYNWVIRNSVATAKRVITVSDNTAKDVRELFGVGQGKITRVWNGVGEEFAPVDEAEVGRVRQKYGLGKFLLYTGVWREHKNLVRLLQAFARLQDKKLKLVITGKPDPNYPEVERTVQELGLGERVVLPGLVSFDDLVALYTGAEVYVFPTLYEGFGLPPLEAMAVGTPAVVSRISSVPEVCSDAVEYFNPEDVEDMAQAMGRVLGDKELQETLIRKGKERVKLFRWDTAAAETLAVYDEVLKKQG